MFQPAQLDFGRSVSDAAPMVSVIPRSMAMYNFDQSHIGSSRVGYVINLINGL